MGMVPDQLFALALTEDTAMSELSDIPYADEVVARTNLAIDTLIIRNPDKARQALEKPSLQGWFAGEVMKEFGGLGDYSGICQMVSERLIALLRAKEVGS